MDIPPENSNQGSAIQRTWSEVLSRLKVLFALTDDETIDYKVIFCSTLVGCKLHPFFGNCLVWGTNDTMELAQKVSGFTQLTHLHGGLNQSILQEFFALCIHVVSKNVDWKPHLSTLQLKLARIGDWRLPPIKAVITSFESLAQDGAPLPTDFFIEWERSVDAMGDLGSSQSEGVEVIENLLTVEDKSVKKITRDLLLTRFYIKIKEVVKSPETRLVDILVYWETLTPLHSYLVIPELLRNFATSLPMVPKATRYDTYQVLYNHLSQNVEKYPLFVLYSIIGAVLTSSTNQFSTDDCINEEKHFCQWLSLLSKPLNYLPIPKLESQIIGNRKCLEFARVEWGAQLNEAETKEKERGNPDIDHLRLQGHFADSQITFSNRVKSIISCFWKQCVDCLGLPPCKIAMIAFGSISRLDMTPYSDIDWAFYLETETPETKEYTKTFVQLFEFFVIGMGETEHNKKSGPRESTLNASKCGLHFDGKMNPTSRGCLHWEVIGDFERLKAYALGGNVTDVVGDIRGYSLITSEVICGSDPNNELMDACSLFDFNTEFHCQVNTFLNRKPPLSEASGFFAIQKPLTREFKWVELFILGRWQEQVVIGSNFPSIDENTQLINLKLLSRPITLIAGTLAVYQNIPLKHPMKIFQKLQQETDTPVPNAFLSLCCYSWYFVNRLRFQKQRSLQEQDDNVLKNNVTPLEWETLVLINQTVVRPWITTIQKHIQHLDSLGPADPLFNPSLFAKIMKPFVKARAQKFRVRFCPGQEFCDAAWAGDLDTLQGWLKKPDFDINALNNRGQNALYCAARNGHVELVLALLNDPRIDVNFHYISPHFSTALHSASFYKHLQVVALLLAAGADPSIRNIYQYRAMDEVSPLDRSYQMLESFSQYGRDHLIMEWPICRRLIQHKGPMKPAPPPRRELISATDFSLFSMVHDFPDRDGWRPSIFNQKIQWQDQLRSLIIAPHRYVLDNGISSLENQIYPPVYITSPTQGCQMLKPELSLKLFQAIKSSETSKGRPRILLPHGDFNFEECQSFLPGSHLVFPIEFGGVKMHIKVNPDAPGIGAAVDLLSNLLVGIISPPAELWLWSCGAFNYPVLVVQTVEGQTFQEMIDPKSNLVDPVTEFSKLEFDNFSQQVVFSMMSNPEDCLFQNVMVTEGNHIMTIDTDRSFVPIQSAANVKNVFFCLNQMESAVPKKTFENLGYLNPAKLLYKWTRRLHHFNMMYSCIFKPAMCEAYYMGDITQPHTGSAPSKNAPAKHCCLLLPWIRQSTLDGIYEKLVYLKDAFAKREVHTHFDILHRLDFQVWYRYFKAFRFSSCVERFAEACGDKTNKIGAVFQASTTVQEYMYSVGIDFKEKSAYDECFKNSSLLVKAAQVLVDNQQKIQSIHKELNMHALPTFTLFESVDEHLQQSVINGIIWLDHLAAWQESFLTRLSKYYPPASYHQFVPSRIV